MGEASVRSRGSRVVAVAGSVLVLAGLAGAQATSILTDTALQHNDAYAPVMTEDGRYVAFFWYANFTESDAFLVDRTAGTVERVSLNSSGKKGNSYSYAPQLSADARYVAFWSFATNLVSGDTNGPYPDGEDVFLRDRQTGTTERASVGHVGQQGNEASYGPVLSADGRYVGFTSLADNLVATDANGVADAFVRDMTGATTELLSVDSAGVQADAEAACTSLSADGRFAVFHSAATNLVTGDTNGAEDVFVRDRLLGTTERVSVATGGGEGDGASRSGRITPYGRYVVFNSSATDLVQGDANGVTDVFLHDRTTGVTERLSVDSTGVEGDGDSSLPVTSPDARFVAFRSAATNLVANDMNGRLDVFLRDRLLGTTERVSLDVNGQEGDQDAGLTGVGLSADGRLVAFETRATLVPPPTGHLRDVFVRDRGPQVSAYCTAGTTSSGCTATVSAVGVASASASSGFDVSVTAVEGGKPGILFWGASPTALPWGAGTSWLCIAAPVTRTGVRSAGGTPGACDGALALDFNAWAAANPGKAPGAGTVAYLQAWFRDPPAATTTSLSDALTFTVGP